MPKNTREWAHRKIASARGNVDWCGTHLEDVKQTYQDAHPEISEVLQLAQELLAHLDEMLVSLVKSF